MTYSRRQLYAMGEPLGDSVTRKVAGKTIYGGGGGGGSQPSSTTQTSTTIPEYARPYAEAALGQAAALTDINANPYQAYGGERYAQFSPLQQQAYQAASSMQTSPELGQAAALAQQTAQKAGATSYQPGSFSSQFNAPAAYQGAGFNPLTATTQGLKTYQMGPATQISGLPGISATQMQAAQTGYNPALQTYQMGQAERVGSQSFLQPGTAEAYMSPYMQNVVAAQQREARRAADIADTSLGARYAQAGAFGGSRQAIERAEARRNLATQLGDIQATGLQSSFQQAQQQFNAEQQARMQAALANQQAGLTVGAQNLAAQLGVQQLGTQTGAQMALANLNAQQQANVQNQAAQLQAQGLNAQQALQAALANQQAGLQVGQQNLAAQLGVQQLGSQQSLQAALANQQANIQAQQLAEQSRQYGYGQQMAAAGMGAQYGQAAQQLGEQSRQYGAGLGMQGLQTAMQGAQQLGNLGQMGYAQQMGINQLQGQYGAQQQQQMQNILNAQYQDFLNAKQYPYQQLGFMSDILRGLPLSQTYSQSYQQPGSMLGQLAGLGLGAYGMMRKEGGPVYSYADGGMATAQDAFSPNGGMFEFAQRGEPVVKMAYGGDVTSDRYVEGAIKRLSNDQLQKALQNALNSRDNRRAEMIQEELQERAEAASYSRGIAGVAPSNMEDMLPTQESMRRGGIVSFAEPTDDNNYSLVTDETAPDEGGGSALRKDISSAWQSIKNTLRPESGVEYEKVIGPLRSKTSPISYMFGDSEEYRKAKVARDWAGANEEKLRNDPDLMARFKADPYGVATTGTGGAPRGVGLGAADQYNVEEAVAHLARFGKPAPETKPAKTDKKASAAATAVGTAVAQTTGAKPEDEITKAKKLMNWFKEQDEPMYKAIQEQINDVKNQAKELGENKVKNALAEFGFKMAAAAAQPGMGSGLAGALRAAGAASPAIMQSVKETEDMQRKYNQLSKQMEVAMLQSRVAADKGDKQAAIGLVRMSEQMDLQRQQLAETIRANKAREGIASARAAAGNTALERAIQQSRTAIARDTAKQAVKDWNDMLVGAKLRKEYPSREAYQKELFDSAWSKAMPQLQYLGTLGGKSGED